MGGGSNQNRREQALLHLLQQDVPPAGNALLDVMHHRLHVMILHQVRLARGNNPQDHLWHSYLLALN